MDKPIDIIVPKIKSGMKIEVKLLRNADDICETIALLSANALVNNKAIKRTIFFINQPHALHPRVRMTGTRSG
jgi:hypothetical protein